MNGLHKHSSLLMNVCAVASNVDAVPDLAAASEIWIGIVGLD